MPNDKGVMTWTLTLEQQFLMGILPTMTAIHELFTRHRLEWTARYVGHYRKDMVRESYASYSLTL